jgi:predicted small secreted protein
MNINTHHNSKFTFQFSTAVVIAALLGVIAMTGCRTMEGAGKDIEKAGEKLQEKASN